MTIDFDLPLKNPRGGHFMEQSFDDDGTPSGTVKVTLGALLYTVLTTPQPNEQVTMMEAARIAKLSATVIAGTASLSVEAKSLLLKRLDNAPISAIAKAAAFQAIDPDGYDEA